MFKIKKNYVNYDAIKKKKKRYIFRLKEQNRHLYTTFRCFLFAIPRIKKTKLISEIIYRNMINFDFSESRNTNIILELFFVVVCKGARMNYEYFLLLKVLSFRIFLFSPFSLVVIEFYVFFNTKLYNLI